MKCFAASNHTEIEAKIRAHFVFAIVKRWKFFKKKKKSGK